MNNGMLRWMGMTGVVTASVLVGCQTNNGSALQRNDDIEVVSEDEANPRINASTYFAHGHLLERQQHFDRAAEQYRRALEISPTFLSARNRLGITLNYLERHAEATHEFETALAQHPGEVHVMNNLGFSLFLEERYDESAAILQRVIDLKPDFHRAHMNYGLVLARTGDFDAALAEFQTATGPADAYYNLAMVQTEAGLFADAARSLETALTNEPSHKLARAQLKEVSRLAAEAEATRFAEAQPPTDAPGTNTSRPIASTQGSDRTPDTAPNSSGVRPMTPIASSNDGSAVCPMTGQMASTGSGSAHTSRSPGTTDGGSAPQNSERPPAHASSTPSVSRQSSGQKVLPMYPVDPSKLPPLAGHASTAAPSNGNTTTTRSESASGDGVTYLPIPHRGPVPAHATLTGTNEQPQPNGMPMLDPNGPWNQPDVGPTGQPGFMAGFGAPPHTAQIARDMQIQMWFNQVIQDALTGQPQNWEERMCQLQEVLDVAQATPNDE